MSGGLMSGGRMSGGRLSGGLKSYDRINSSISVVFAMDRKSRVGNFIPNYKLFYHS